MSIKNRTGSPVTGDDFFDREYELKQLLKAIEAKDHVLITAPRRVGKSSLLKKALKTMESRRWLSVEADVQQCKNEADFLEQLMEGLRDAGIEPSGLDKLKTAIDQLRKWLGGHKVSAAEVSVEIPNNDDGNEWKEVTKQFEAIVESLKGRSIVFGLDELPIFLARLVKEASDGPSRVNVILHWLRSLRHLYPNFVWVICGSVGLDTFTQQHNLSGAINDLKLQRLEAFSDSTAREFLVQLGNSPENPLPLSDAVIDAMLKRVGWPLPYFLQLIFQSLEELHPEKRSTSYPSVDDVETAAEELLGAHFSQYFAHWVTRLPDQLSKPCAAAAEFLLGKLCRSSRGHSRSKLSTLMLTRRPESPPEEVEKQLSFLLDVLERDGYLYRHGASSFAFRSFLLRDFWKRRTS